MPNIRGCGVDEKKLKFKHPVTRKRKKISKTEKVQNVFKLRGKSKMY
jgi:hypothetical protein